MTQGRGFGANRRGVRARSALVDAPLRALRVVPRVEWELNRELYALPGFRCEQVLPMVLVVCKTCRNSRLYHVLADGLVWRGDDAGQEIVRQALPPPPGVLPRLIDTWKRIVAYLRQD